ncbi:MAG: peptidase S8, partial [Tissierellia bacterium]|nr:peptidase S8 [Tissierellia bacterium]
SVALLLNKFGDLKLEEVKERLISSCIDLKDSKDNQGAGMLNLKLLFEDNLNNPVLSESISSKPHDKDFFENILMILIILFLLDSRI